MTFGDTSWPTMSCSKDRRALLELYLAHIEARHKTTQASRTPCGSRTLIRLTSNSRRSSAAFVPSAESACFFTCSRHCFPFRRMWHADPFQALLRWRAGRCNCGNRCVCTFCSSCRRSLSSSRLKWTSCAHAQVGLVGGPGQIGGIAAVAETHWLSGGGLLHGDMQ